MNQRYLFLLKFLGYSLVLFIFRHTVLDGYTAVLQNIITTFTRQFHIPPDMKYFIYSTSITMLAFVALILSTPKIPIVKRLLFVLIGLGVFLVIDAFGLNYIIYPQRPVPPDDESIFRELYLSCKWVLPFLIWIIMVYKYLGEFFTRKQEAEPTAQ